VPDTSGNEKIGQARKLCKMSFSMAAHSPIAHAFYDMLAPVPE
jgi:hypothetical protein